MSKFKVGSTYHASTPGNLVQLDDVFAVEYAEGTHYTLWGHYVGYEELGIHRFWESGLHGEVDWPQYFERWLQVRLYKMDTAITRKLNERLSGDLFQLRLPSGPRECHQV